MNDAPLRFVDIRQFAQRNLLAGGRADEQIADLLRVLAELRLHAHDEVEELFALDHLRGRLPADGRLDHGFHVRHIDAVARDLVAVRRRSAGWAGRVRAPRSVP